jgi:predicted unusual protein kinase regulating ubiquinone biosynthesis (AarF/ABC1/UbiB family)
MEQELGVPWEDVFETIDAEPLAAGTIAQVHRATLSSGERVVVKVQRPGARNEIMRDLALLDAFAQRLAKRPSITQVLDVPAIVGHLSSSLEHELDFQHEAANIERMRGVLAPYSRLDVPQVHTHLTTRRLLVMEEIPGVPIAAAPEGPAKKVAARQLIESYYRQVLTEGFFHADPHPGNLMWCDGKVYFLDLGMVGEVGTGLREDLLMLLLALWKEDEAFLTEVTLALAGSEPPPDLDVAALRTDLGALLVRTRHVPLQQLQLGAVLQEMTQISLRHGVRLPSSLILTGKALSQVQLATAALDPELDPFEVAGRFVARSTLGAARGALEPTQALYELRKFRARLLRALEAFERLAGSRPGPKLQVQFRGIEGIETNIRRAGRRVALALAVAGSCIATAIVATSERVGTAWPTIFGVLTGLLLLWLTVEVIRRE